MDAKGVLLGIDLRLGSQKWKFVFNAYILYYIDESPDLYAAWNAGRPWRCRHGKHLLGSQSPNIELEISKLVKPLESLRILVFFEI